MSTIDFAQLQVFLGGLLWAMGRVAGFVLVAPVFGSSVIPARIRVAISLMLTLILAPLAPARIDPMSGIGVATTISQVLIGVSVAFVLKLVFEAVSFGGQMISQGMNLSFSEVVNPQGGGSTTVLSQYYMALAILIFVSMNGHLRLLGLLAESFRSLPPGGNLIDVAGLHAVVMFGSELFAGAVRVALPAITSLLVVNIGFAAISRAAPSMNLFAVGFPITITLGIVVLWLSLRSLPGALQALEDNAWSLMGQLIGH